MPALLSRTLLCAAGILAFALPAGAQSPAPTYDVVSIKPNKAGSDNIMINFGGDGYSGSNVTVQILIQQAYDLKTDKQIANLPGWGESTHFDIQAKMDADAVAALKKLPKEEATAQRRLMLQAMLADRFKLQIHHETRDLKTFDLVQVKGGSKLKEADPTATYSQTIKDPSGNKMSGAGSFMMSNNELTANAVPISSLVSVLSGHFQTVVTDKTGLSGKYDLHMKWAGDETHPSSPDDATGPSIYTALQEQLGLKLDSVKSPVDTIVIDHIEMPGEN